MESSPISVRQAAANWWVYVLAGVSLIGLGIWAFSNPASAFLGLTFTFAAVILFNGVAGTFFALTNRDHLRGWGWLLALGLIEVVFGFYLISAPIAAAGTLALFIGFWLLLRSGSTVANAFVLRRLGYRNWGWTLAMGLLGLVLGVIVITNPAIGALGATVWLAAALLVLGGAALVLGLRLRRAAHHG